MSEKRSKPNKKKHPAFKRMNCGRTDRRRIKDKWRTPRGIDNKQREKRKFTPSRPGIGWRNAKKVRDIHPSGFEEARVFSVADLRSLDKGKQAVRIAASVGGKKRKEIVEEAEKNGFKVLN